MENLLKEAMSLTNEKLNKRNHKLSINNRIVEVLKDGSRIQRVELVTRITILRLKEENPNFNEVEFTKLIKARDEKTVKHFNKTWTTCKNGVDTSLADGSTNSNFSYNPMFNTKWTINKHSDKSISLTKK